MVHKKSEYNLQYHQLTQDLRKDIWQQNIKFRELHRSLNQAHHYWTYQVSEDRCECDSDQREQPAGVDAAALRRVEHGASEVRIRQGSGDSCPGKIESSEAAREVGCQTPDWKGDAKPWEEPGSSSRGGSAGTAAKKTSGGAAVEALLPAERPQSSCGKPSPSLRVEERAQAPLRTEKTAPPGRSRSPTRFSQLSRTSRKAFSQGAGRQLPFTSYGWNDSSRDVGTKKTYNVRAPQLEVYQPALRAQRLRREEVEDYLRWEAASRRWDHADQGKVVNHSSVWMSEYQEQFSQRAARAQSAPPLRKTAAWC